MGKHLNNAHIDSWSPNNSPTFKSVSEIKNRMAFTLELRWQASSL